MVTLKKSKDPFKLSSLPASWAWLGSKYSSMNKSLLLCCLAKQTYLNWIELWALIEREKDGQFKEKFIYINYIYIDKRTVLKPIFTINKSVSIYLNHVL